MNLRLVILLCTIQFSLSLFGQKSIIDEKNGFKTIKLGTPRSAFSDLEFYQKTDITTAYRYRPTDSDLYYVFNTRYDGIFLHFDEGDKLVLIMLAKVYTGSNFYENALQNSRKQIEAFNQIFGVFDERSNNDGSGDGSVTWYGQKAFISVGWLYFGIVEGRAESTVLVGKMTRSTDGF